VATIHTEIRRSEIVAFGALGLILMVALTLRFHDLGRSPLTPTEAAESLWAWAPAAGGFAPPIAGGPESPLYLQLQTWVFFLFGANDSMARMCSAVAGSLLVAGVWWWRHTLGTAGTLIAALLLAIDPHLVSAARRAGPDMLALCVGFYTLSWPILRNALNGRTPDSRMTLGVCVGLLLTLGPTGWILAVLSLGHLLLAENVSPRSMMGDSRGSTTGDNRLWRGITITVGLVVFSLWWVWQVSPQLGLGFDRLFEAATGERSLADLRQTAAGVLAREPLLLATVAIGLTLLVQHHDRRSTALTRLLLLILLGYCLVPLPALGAMVVPPTALFGGWAVAGLLRLQPDRKSLGLLLLLALTALSLQLRATRFERSTADSHPRTMEASSSTGEDLALAVDRLRRDQPKRRIAIVGDPWVEPLSAWTLREVSASWLPALPTIAPTDGILFLSKPSSREIPTYRARRFLIGWEEEFVGVQGRERQPVYVVLWEPTS
jgi:hypothetical protein